VSATSPPCTLLVMAAIEPGWEKFLQVPPLSSLRAQPHLFSGSLFLLRDSRSARGFAVVLPQGCRSARARRKR
jgi:hypothetical protein